MVEYAQTIAVVVSIISLVGGLWKVSRDIREDNERMICKIGEANKEIRKEFKDTVALIFSRFDDHKTDTDKKLFLIQNHVEDKFVRQDLCNKTSGNIEGRLKSIDLKLDALLMERHGTTS